MFSVQCLMFASKRAVAVACSRFIGVVSSTEPEQAFAAANASTTFASLA